MAKLFLIPTTLTNPIAMSAILNEDKLKIHHLINFVVETAKIGRQHIKYLDLATSLQQLNIQELNKHKYNILELISPLKQGYDVGLLSDCGCPAIADPGNQLVIEAHKLGHQVIPLVGPNSIVMGLMSSGLNGQNFCFNGYLPLEGGSRLDELSKINNLIMQKQQTQIYIEAPFRNQKTFEIFINQLNPQIKLCLGINLMNENQQILTKSIFEWKNTPINLNKQEVIFLLGL